MLGKLGGLFGWIMIVAFVATLLNYIIKMINKKWGKSIRQSTTGKKIMKVLTLVFIRNHKYWGLLAALMLVIHFLIQFNRFGLNLTGGIAAFLILIQVGLGIYANLKKCPRKGIWFVLHRTIAILIIVGIALHLLAPYALNNIVFKEDVSTVSTEVPSSNLPVYSLEKLAEYNGQNGAQAYVAYEGMVYDVSNLYEWNNGQHNGQSAGTDVTDALSLSPHGDSVFKNLTIVGTLE